MRDFLNAILTQIGTATLTDDEYAGLTISVYGYDQETYNALLSVLVSREAVSSIKNQLLSYFQAKDPSIGAVSTATTQIYVGSVLE